MVMLLTFTRKQRAHFLVPLARQIFSGFRRLCCPYCGATYKQGWALRHRSSFPLSSFLWLNIHGFSHHVCYLHLLFNAHRVKAGRQRREKKSCEIYFCYTYIVIQVLIVSNFCKLEQRLSRKRIYSRREPICFPQNSAEVWDSKWESGGMKYKTI